MKDPWLCKGVVAFKQIIEPELCKGSRISGRFKSLGYVREVEFQAE